jgi:hypothetical protein
MVDQNQKVDYWFYYYENGNKKEEGHYEDNKNVNGGFYESNKEVNKKSEFKTTIKWLFFILQNNIIRAEKIL